MKNSKSKLGNCDEYPGAKKSLCHHCQQPFVLNPLGGYIGGWKHTKIIVEEVQNDNFRGNDDVYFYHPKCHYLKNH